VITPIQPDQAHLTGHHHTDSKSELDPGNNHIATHALDKVGLPNKAPRGLDSGANKAAQCVSTAARAGQINMNWCSSPGAPVSNWYALVFWELCRACIGDDCVMAYTDAWIWRDTSGEKFHRFQLLRHGTDGTPSL
jgi:hypothetical protein